jgi:hypothetical protein
MVLRIIYHWHGPSIRKFECVIGTVDGHTGIVLKGIGKGVHGDDIIEDGIQIQRPFFTIALFSGAGDL